MRLLPLLSLTLATLTAANPISIPSDHASSDLTLVPRNDPRSFTGRGQLRTRWYQGDYDDLGCLTDTGLWTSDESQCGTFTAQPLEGVSTLVTYTLSSAAGPCWIVGAKFECGWGQQPGWFGVSAVAVLIQIKDGVVGEWMLMRETDLAVPELDSGGGLYEVWELRAHGLVEGRPSTGLAAGGSLHVVQRAGQVGVVDVGGR